MFESCDSFDDAGADLTPCEPVPETTEPAPAVPDDGSLVSELQQQYNEEHAGDGFQVDPFADIWEDLRRGRGVQDGGAVPPPSGPTLAEIDGQLDSSAQNNGGLPREGQVADYDPQLGRVEHRPLDGS